MHNLFLSNCNRMFKNKLFFALCGVMFLFGFSSPISSAATANGVKPTPDGSLFSFCLFAVAFASIFIAMFVGTEFSDGTIRNKLIVGNTRSSIYVSFLLIGMVACLFFALSYLLPYVALSFILLSPFSTSFGTIVLALLASMAIFAAFSAIYTMIVMLNTKKATVAVLSLLVMMGLIFVGNYIGGLLAKTDPNGMKYKLISFAYDFIPGNQAMRLKSSTPTKLILFTIYSAIACIGLTIIGAYKFKKKDLK